jgi:hypothetical protein
MEEIKKLKQLITNLQMVRRNVMTDHDRDRIDHNIKIHEETIKRLQQKKKRK